MRKTLAFVAPLAVALAVTLAVWTPWASSAGNGSQYEPMLSPADFTTTIDNPYFPLPVGRTLVYEGVKDGQSQIDTVTVTDQTKVIEGITARMVSDVSTHDGTLLEKTFDFYAQDKQGNVWYMGEDARELQNGRFVRASDSWKAGVNGAKPGIIMRGNPKPNEVYRQEYYPPGGALDQGRVLGLGVSVKVPYGTFTKSLATIEWSPVEPQLEKKYYVSGIGEVKEQVTQGGHERFELVSLTQG